MLWGLFYLLGMKMPAFVFPVQNWLPGYPYTVMPRQYNMRAFGSRRDHGRRKHAGCDLYAPCGADVYSVTDGRVVEIVRGFYGGASMVAVDHGAVGICNYCEINLADDVDSGSVVKSGDVLGSVAKLHGPGLGSCHPMLHFEMYKGEGSGSLLNKKNAPYMRRSDLMDPTVFLQTVYAMGEVRRSSFCTVEDAIFQDLFRG